MNATTDPQVIDETAAQIVEAVLGGQISDTDGRHRLADLAGRSLIVEEAVGKRHDLSPANLDVVLSAVYETVTIKILVPSERGYSFEAGRGKSFSGYVRNLTRSCTPSAVRDHVYRPNARLVLTSLTDSNMEPNFGGRDNIEGSVMSTPTFCADTTRFADSGRVVLGTARDDGADTHLTSEEERQWSAEVDSIVYGATHMFRQPQHRPHYAAALTLRVTGTPEAIRPVSLAKRTRLHRILSAENGMDTAVASLRAYLADEPTPENAELVDLWGDYSQEDARVLLCREAQMVHAVALAAVSRLPLPNYRARTALASRLAAKDPHCEDYVGLLPDLMRSLLAVECHHVSPNAPESRPGEHLTVEDEKAWAGLVSEAANLPGAPLGSTITAVKDELRSQLMATMPTLTYEGVLTAAVDKLAHRAKNPEAA